MSYERQRATALRMVKKNGTKCVLHSRTTTTPDPTRPWIGGGAVSKIPAYCVTFADDGVTFVNHNIEGDSRVATIVGDTPLDIHVGDSVEIHGKLFSIELAKPLDPDMTGAILWAALIV